MSKNTMLLHSCWLQKAWRNTSCLSCENGLSASTWWSTVSRHRTRHIVWPLEHKILKRYLRPGLLHFGKFILILETLGHFLYSEIARIYSAVYFTALFQSKIRKQTCYIFNIIKKLFKNENNCDQLLGLIWYHFCHQVFIPAPFGNLN